MSQGESGKGPFHKFGNELGRADLDQLGRLAIKSASPTGEWIPRIQREGPRAALVLDLPFIEVAFRLALAESRSPATEPRFPDVVGCARPALQSRHWGPGDCRRAESEDVFPNRRCKVRPPVATSPETALRVSVLGQQEMPQRVRLELMACREPELRRRGGRTCQPETLPPACCCSWETVALFSSRISTSRCSMSVKSLALNRSGAQRTLGRR